MKANMGGYISEDFRIGDTWECTKSNSSFFTKGNQYHVVEKYGKITMTDNDNLTTFPNISEFKLITRGGSKISKYEEMVERIEKVEGWDKEADDILTEIRGKYFTRVDFSISQDRKDSKTYATGEIKVNNNSIGFYHNFYEKNEIFKQALRWLLDNSSIKPAPKVTIADLMKEVEDSMQALREEINDN